MSIPSERTLLNACRLLFGDEIELCREFLIYLQPDGAKAAYRARAKEHHPDRFAGQPAEIRRRQSERFQELTRAYHLLRNYFLQREAGGRVEVQRSTGYQPTANAGAPPRGGYPHPRVPAVPLEFGLFLFHRGKITYQELIAALLWQRRQRPSIGSIAQRWGWLDQAKVERVLQDRGNYRRFGNRAVNLGFLTPTQVQVLVRYQQSLHRRLGEYFIEQGLLAANELEQLAGEHLEHNRRCAARERVPPRRAACP